MEVKTNISVLYHYVFDKSLFFLKKEFNNEELWKARKIKEAIKNPDSGEIIPMPFRMSGFVPFGVPIVVGMLLPNPSLPTTLFFQWLNQTHNALVNYYNRPILPGVPTNTRRLVEAYVGAVTSALGVSAGLQYLFRNSTSFIKNFVPFFAVASANICNVTLMRRDELTNGIEIKNQKGEVVGISQVAAKKALFETALTRVALPLPLLTFPPLIMGYLNQMNWLKTRPFLQLPIQTAICTAAFGFALPIAIALFPQYGTIPGHKLEQDRFAKYSQDTLIYNKGL